MALPLIPIAMGALGALAGSQGSTQESTSSTTSGIRLDPNTAAGKYADEDVLKQYQGLGNLVDAGPGQQDVDAGLQSSRGLASMLEQYSQNGGMPSQQDIGYANQFTSNVFAPQQNSLNNMFADQQVQANRAAGMMGRGLNDPILRNKMMQEQVRSQMGLDSQKTAFGAQQAQQMSMQRLGFASQLADTRNSLASQAMANRQALLGMGQSIQSNERNFRLQTGTRWSDSKQTQSGGGGLGGAIKGALGGIGAGMGAMSMFGGGGSGGGNPFGEIGSQMANGDTVAASSGAVQGPSMAPAGFQMPSMQRASRLASPGGMFNYNSGAMNMNFGGATGTRGN